MNAHPTSPPDLASLPVFDRLGAIVRSLHDVLREIGADEMLNEVASEFPSARERLLHIGRLTEKAANTVLTKVEEALPLQDELGERAVRLRAQSVVCSASLLPSDPLQLLIGEVIAFTTATELSCHSTRSALSDMMIAQDFQDLTGQLIKKVVALLQQTETSVLSLLIDTAPPGVISLAQKEEIMAGPGAPGGVALAQNDIDDLLADLGF